MSVILLLSIDMVWSVLAVAPDVSKPSKSVMVYAGGVSTAGIG